MRALAIMMLTVISSTGAGCGDDGASPVDAAGDAAVDGPPSTCQPLGATGQFIRRAANPRLLPKQDFADGKIDIHIADPDVRWDDAAQRWEVAYAAGHATTYTSVDKVAVIRRASSTDRVTWTVDEAPMLTASTDAAAWDHDNTETPTVVFNPAAPADRRYLMLYSGSNGVFPHANYTFANYRIGAAFSADGRTFTRVSAAESPHGQAGLVMTAAQIYPASVDGVVADPDVVLVNGVYHAFFSSFSCTGVDCANTETYGIAHASSADGITWTTVGEAPIRGLLRASADPKTGGGQPSVIYDPIHCRWELWLTNDLANDTSAQPAAFNNMAGVWHADSTDGLTWNVNYAFNRDLAWDVAEPGEPLGLLTGADVGNSGNGRLMLFVGFDDDNVPAGFALPARAGGTVPGVFALNVATRDLP